LVQYVVVGCVVGKRERGMFLRGFLYMGLNAIIEIYNFGQRLIVI
jgi:hypothetical protein